MMLFPKCFYRLVILWPRTFSSSLLPISSNLSSAAGCSMLPSTGPSFQIQLSPNSSDPARGLRLVFITTPRFWLMLMFPCDSSWPLPLSFPTSLCHSFSLSCLKPHLQKMSLNNFPPLSTLFKIQNYSSMLLFLFSSSRIVVCCSGKRPWIFSIPHTPHPLNLDMRKLRPRKKMGRKVTMERLSW